MKFKTKLYGLYWLWKNRKWKNTRQKSKAFKKAITYYEERNLKK